MTWLSRPRSAVRKARLHLEVLEARSVPANLSLVGGSLTVSNPRIVGGTTNLQVTQLSDGRFQVFDQGSSLGAYRVTGSITVNGSNAPDSIAVSLDNSLGNGTLFGGLSINAGNGNDSVQVDGSGGTVGPIRGALNGDRGYGYDTS